MDITMNSIPVALKSAAESIPLGATVILPAADYPDMDRLAHSQAMGEKLKAIELYGMIWGDCVDD